MNSPTLIRRIAVISALCTPALLAQSITICATAHRDLSVSATTQEGKQTQFVTPAGTPIPSCFALTTQGPVASPSQATLSIITSETAESVGVDLQATAWAPAGGTGSAGSGLSEIIVQVTLAHAMTLELDLNGAITVCSGPPTGKVAIDIGNDGSRELEIMAQSAPFEELQRSLTMTLPAGTTDIMIATELEILRQDATGGFVAIATSLTVRPGHTVAASEEAACGAELEVAPLFNGNVRFSILDEQADDILFLALGGARQTLPLPSGISAGCNLLITPDWIVPIQPFSPEFIPLICMGTGQLFAQAAIFRQPATGTASGSFGMSQRVAIEVR